MNAHIAILQTIQLLLIGVVLCVLAFYVVRTFVKIKVHKAVYGNDMKGLNRYIEDKILEKQAQLNRNQEG